MQDRPHMIAVILCGGQSSRMGEPKALMSYNGKPQYQWLYQQCNSLSISAYLSCKQNQLHWFSPNYRAIVDAPEFEDAGPMTGLLSAASQNPSLGILLLACDYPALQTKDIENLILHFNKHQKSTCLVHPQSEMIEPLLAIYHPMDLVLIEREYASGNHSLQQYLQKADIIKVMPQNTLSIKSSDTPTDKDFFGL